MPYSTVVVGTDGSATAETAVEARGKLAADHGARLVIVTAYETHGDDRATKTQGPSDDIKWALTDRDQAEEKARYGAGAGHRGRRDERRRAGGRREPAGCAARDGGRLRRRRHRGGFEGLDGRLTIRARKRGQRRLAPRSV